MRMLLKDRCSWENKKHTTSQPLKSPIRWELTTKKVKNEITYGMEEVNAEEADKYQLPCDNTSVVRGSVICCRQVLI